MLLLMGSVCALPNMLVRYSSRLMSKQSLAAYGVVLGSPQIQTSDFQKQGQLNATALSCIMICRALFFFFGVYSYFCIIRPLQPIFSLKTFSACFMVFRFSHTECPRSLVQLLYNFTYVQVMCKILDLLNAISRTV